MMRARGGERVNVKISSEELKGLKKLVRHFLKPMLWIKAFSLFLRGVVTVSLFILAAFTSMYLFIWLGPPAICIIFSVGGGFLIGWKLGEKKRDRRLTYYQAKP